MNTSDSILRLNGYPWMCPDLAIGSNLTRARDPADPSSLLMSRLQKVCFHYTKSQNNSGRHRITVAVNQTCSWHIAAKPVCQLPRMATATTAAGAASSSYNGSTVVAAYEQFHVAAAGLRLWRWLRLLQHGSGEGGGR